MELESYMNWRIYGHRPITDVYMYVIIIIVLYIYVYGTKHEMLILHVDFDK